MIFAYADEGLSDYYTPNTEHWPLEHPFIHKQIIIECVLSSRCSGAQDTAGNEIHKSPP